MSEFSATLGEIVDMKKGISYRSAELVDSELNGIPLINLKSFKKSGGFNENGLKYFSGDCDDSNLILEDDIIIANTDLTPNGDILGSPILLPKELHLKKVAFSVDTTRYRITDQRVVPAYLYRLLQTPLVRIQFKRYLRGATVKRFAEKDAKKIELSFPSIEEQKRIVGILDKLDEMKTTSIQIQYSRNRIIQSAFVEMFGDPVVNPHNHPKILFRELGTLDRGKSKHRPRNDPMLLGGNHPLIQTGEIRSADLFVDTFTSTYSDFGLAQSRKWPAGTLAITIAANIAESAILGIEACFPDSIVGFTPNSNTNSIFIKAQLDFLKDRISEVAPQSAQKNINLKILREIPMICPSVELQEQFEDFVRNTTRIFDSINKGIDMAEELTHSSVQSLIN